MMKRSFIKMQGLGNDFIVFDARADVLMLGESVVRQLCDRRLGIGADMVIVLEPASDADVFMRILNFDGSEVGACGNATRCVAGLLMRENGNDAITIKTIAGLLYAQKTADGLVSVDMGVARTNWQEIPLLSNEDTAFIELKNEELPQGVAVNMGNPHIVFFVDDVAAVDLERLGPWVENHPLFPARTNVEFVERLADGHLRMRVWERGVGVTPACGSGACATVVAAVRRGIISGRSARVVLDGGELDITYKEDGRVVMVGPWAEVYRGEVIFSATVSASGV